MKDCNETIQGIKEAAHDNGIDTIVSVVRQGGGVHREVVNSSISLLKPLTSYSAPGNDTPLFDSVDTLIGLIESAPDYNQPGVTYLVMAITDGQENASRITAQSLATKIRNLQATDKWTFVFRVPYGYKNALVNKLGVPQNNVQEWEQTERGFRESTAHTQSAIGSYYVGVSRGITSSKSFYTDLSGVKATDARAVGMVNISGEVDIFPVRSAGEIHEIVSQKTGRPYQKGTGFYQLSKTEKIVQGYKLIAIRNQNTGAVYAGVAARDLLNLPHSGNITLKPGNHGEWDVFVQSTSTNRKLLPGTNVLYWSRPTVI
jgi:hypothetical protein